MTTTPTVNVVIRLPAVLLSRLERRRSEVRLSRDTFVHQALDWVLRREDLSLEPAHLTHLSPPLEASPRAGQDEHLLRLARMHNLESAHVVDVRIGEFDQRVTCQRCPWEREATA